MNSKTKASLETVMLFWHIRHVRDDSQKMHWLYIWRTLFIQPTPETWQVVLWLAARLSSDIGKVEVRIRACGTAKERGERGERKVSIDNGAHSQRGNRTGG